MSSVLETVDVFTSYDASPVLQLGFAFSIYTALIWYGLDYVRSRPVIEAAARASALRVRPAVMAATAIIGVTVASGAFVAGNDAGHAYNDWPFFAGRLVPEQIWEPQLGARNFTENTATVQFDHRMLAYTTIAAVGGIHMAAARAGGLRAMPPRVAAGAKLLGVLVACQATLGIATLMLYVPTWLGAAHQAGALALLTGAISLAHSVHVATRASTAVSAAPAARSAVAAGVLFMSVRSSSSDANIDADETQRSPLHRVCGRD